MRDGRHQGTPRPTVSKCHWVINERGRITSESFHCDMCFIVFYSVLMKTGEQHRVWVAIPCSHECSVKHSLTFWINRVYLNLGGGHWH